MIEEVPRASGLHAGASTLDYPRGTLRRMSDTRRIEDYALLGDLQTAVLVHRTGSIDWCCFPRFDSDACFAALLGEPEHGRWLLAPATETRRSKRRYRPLTLILETIHETAEGSVRVIDFMPPRGKAPDIVRIVEGISGHVPMRSELIIRFDYGHIVPWVRRTDHARVANADQDPGPHHEDIHQSLLVLKALTYAPTGGIVASPTTSLPERIGGVRNWDYRYCWLRDASLTLLAMLSAGYRDEALAWREWLLRTVAGDPSDVQIMYGVAGERRIEERIIPWLPRLADSQTVRVGNAASHQRQLDIYGEVLDAAYQTLAQGIEGSQFGWSLIKHLLAWLADHWQEEDAGIWEVRGPLRDFTHSKMMAWVAFDRAVRIHDEFGRDGPVDQWRELRDEIRAEVLRCGWSERKQAFTQSYGSDELDASILLMPIVGFLPADDPRVVSTVEAIRRELSVDGLLRRYRSQDAPEIDGLPAGEGVFLACSFWLGGVPALQGRLGGGPAPFLRLLGLRNDLGLLSEEYDPKAGMLLGNFPQAFTHLALVEAALTLAEHRSPRGVTLE